jgi:O-antigen ligase
MIPTHLNKRSNKPNEPWSDLDRTTNESPSEFAALNSPADRGSRKVKKNKGNKWHRISLYFALGLVFVRLSMIHQLLEYLLHADIYLLYFVAIPVLFAIPAMGGFKRAFQFRPALYWTAFALWLLPTSLFSSWKMGSLNLVTGYYRTELVLLFAIGGLVTTWRECRWLMYTISSAALVNLVSVLLFRKVDDDGRTSLVFGTVRNSNDYSGHLIFVLPFLVWVVLITKSTYLRICGLLALALGLYEILAAGSRGAMIGLATAIAVFALTTTPKVRRIVLVVAPVLAVLVITLLPSAVVHRIFLFSADNSAISEGAMESSHDREQLLKDSIATTIRHPLFGVGPGQFANVEGQQTAQAGQKLWYDAHNSFMEIASENGIPGLIFYLGGVLSSLFLLNKTGRLLKGKPGVAEAVAAVLCVRIGLISFCVTIFFLNFGYYFYLPAMAGISIAVSASCERLLAATRGSQALSRNGVHATPKTI